MNTRNRQQDDIQTGNLPATSQLGTFIRPRALTTISFSRSPTSSSSLMLLLVWRGWHFGTYEHRVIKFLILICLAFLSAWQDVSLIAEEITSLVAGASGEKSSLLCPPWRSLPYNPLLRVLCPQHSILARGHIYKTVHFCSFFNTVIIDEVKKRKKKILFLHSKNISCEGFWWTGPTSWFPNWSSPIRMSSSISPNLEIISRWFFFK